MKLFSRILGICLLGCTTATFAQSYKNEFTLKSDNDAYLWYGQDKYYTNGLFLNWRHALDQQQLNKNIEKRTIEVEIGQKMFNPYSGYAPDPATHDRPFAGYLYAGLGLNTYYANETVLRLNAQVGTIGKNSLGQKGQELLHRIIGYYEIKGWDYQVKNELGLNLNANYLKLLTRNATKDLDISLEANAALGNTFTNINAGILLRTGRLNQFFNSAYTNSQIENKPKTAKLQHHELFFYAKPALNYVIYDATIQGGLFNNDKGPVTFPVKRMVFSADAGVMYSSERWTLAYGLTFKTKEVNSNIKTDQWGSMSIGYRFN